MRRCQVAIILAGILALLATPAAAKRIPPRDECSTDPAFGAFYRQFRAIIARRDAPALIALIPAKGASMDFGGSSRSEFVALWHLKRGARSELWPVLSEVLDMGCARDGRDFISPYYFNHLDNTDPNGDPGDDVVSFGKATLRSAPSATAPAVADLHWDQLHTDYSRKGTATKGWRAVRDDAGRRGFIPEQQLRGGLDYRAMFRKVHGHWAFSFFGDGD